MRELVESQGLGRMRRLLLLLLVVAMIGTAADLLLLAHYESPWQAVPLVLIVLGLASAGAAAVTGGAGPVSVLRIVMALFVCAGLVGIGLHYLGNTESQRELDPGLQGWNLFVKVMTAKAPPALAPAAMVQMGLLGLLYTYRHPALRLWLTEGDPGP